MALPQICCRAVVDTHVLRYVNIANTLLCHTTTSTFVSSHTCKLFIVLCILGYLEKPSRQFLNNIRILWSELYRFVA